MPSHTREEREKRRHRSKLRTKFNPQEEGRRLRREPNRAKVEGIRELRNRPDPAGDAFLGAAAREAGIDPVRAGFGGARGSDITLGDKVVRPAPARDESFGVNPRDGGFKENFERNFREQVGKTDFTDPTRGASGLRNRARNTSPIQLESTTPGRSNPPKTENFVQNPDEGEERDTGGGGTFQGLRNRGFDVESAQVIASASPDSRLSTGVIPGRTITGSRRLGGTVSTVPAESFVNPAYTGFVTPEQQAAREAPVRRELAREQRQREIDDDLEFRRSLRQRQLLDDANLRLSGDMTLTELADAAQRRRSARETLRQRDTQASDQAIAQQQQAQARELELVKEDGRNRRKLAELEGTREGEKLARQIERADRALTQSTMIENDEGEKVPSPTLELRARQLIVNSGRNPDTINEAEAVKFGNTAVAIHNIEQASDAGGGAGVGVSIESISELQEIIGFTDRELLEGLGDDAELHLVNKDGQLLDKPSLKDVVNGDPGVARVLREHQGEKVRVARLQFRERSPFAFLTGQGTDPDFGDALNSPEGALERQEAAGSLRDRARRVAIGRRGTGRFSGPPS